MDTHNIIILILISCVLLVVLNFIIDMYFGSISIPIVRLLCKFKKIDFELRVLDIKIKNEVLKSVYGGKNDVEERSNIIEKINKSVIVREFDNIIPKNMMLLYVNNVTNKTFDKKLCT